MQRFFFLNLPKKTQFLFNSSFEVICNLKYLTSKLFINLIRKILNIYLNLLKKSCIYNLYYIKLQNNSRFLKILYKN